MSLLCVELPVGHLFCVCEFSYLYSNEPPQKGCGNKTAVVLINRQTVQSLHKTACNHCPIIVNVFGQF